MKLAWEYVQVKTYKPGDLIVSMSRRSIINNAYRYQLQK